MFLRVSEAMAADWVWGPGFLPCPPQGDRETGKVTVQGRKPMMPQEIRTKGKVTAIIINKD